MNMSFANNGNIRNCIRKGATQEMNLLQLDISGVALSINTPLLMISGRDFED
jgi:hypothetical protein